MDNSILQDFLVECGEGLERLDLEFVSLENDPTNKELIGSIFRTIHTIKGTCGFLALTKLEAVAHVTESILSQMRDGKLPVTSDGVSVLLEGVDAIKEIMTHIESKGIEPKKDYNPVQKVLKEYLAGGGLVKPHSTGKKKLGSAKEQVQVENTPEEKVPADPPPEKTVSEEKKVVAPTTGGVSASDSSIRVNVRLLDELMNLVGELVLARNQLLLRVRDQQDLADAVTIQRLNLITTELQDAVMKTRMQPIRNVWDKFPRVIRDLSRATGKDVELLMEGADTELDKTLLEAIKDPLTHIVRNAVDHGVESAEVRAERGKPPKGKLLLNAYHEGGQINIEISDDGAGINVEKVVQKVIDKGIMTSEAISKLSEQQVLNLVFLPGLSTADQVTNVSGRGVGMDVVRSNIERIGGSIELSHRPGHGMKMKIRIPLTLAIIPALMVIVNGEQFAIPQASLSELVRVDPDSGERIEVIDEAEFYRLRGVLLPLVHLRQILKMESSENNSENKKEEEHNKEISRNELDHDLEDLTTSETNIVVLGGTSHPFGLVVDEVSDSEEIVVKPLSRYLKGITAFAGATIMGDGRVALILDVLGIARQGGLLQEKSEDQKFSSDEKLDGALSDEYESLLIFTNTDEDQYAIPLSLVDRLEEFDPGKFEEAGGGKVIQYRGSLLPLIPLHQALGTRPPQDAAERSSVIVFSGDGRNIGLVVGRIIDIIEDRVKLHRSPVGKNGIVGSVVVHGKTTELLDIYEVIKQSLPGWLQGKGYCEVSRKAQILLVEDSPFYRGILKPQLESEGYSVLEAVNGEEAYEILSHQHVDLVLTDINMPKVDGMELAWRIRSSPQFHELPMVALISSKEDADRIREQGIGFRECLLKSDREAIVEAVHRLMTETEKVGVPSNN